MRACFCGLVAQCPFEACKTRIITRASRIRMHAIEPTLRGRFSARETIADEMARRALRAGGAAAHDKRRVLFVCITIAVFAEFR